MDQADDRVVCAAAIANGAILIAIDRDFNQLAKRYGATPKGDQFDKLNVIRICCNEVLASKRLEQALPLIEMEWEYSLVKRLAGCGSTSGRTSSVPPLTFTGRRLEDGGLP